MPSSQALLGFALASFLIIVIPGPSVLFAVARSLSMGRRSGLVTVLGNTSAQIPLIIAVAVGLGAVVAESIALFTIVKLLGAAYLVYLGIQAIRHRNEADESSDGVETAVPLRKVYWQGFAVGVTNPKSIVFFLAVLPQFVDYHAGAVPIQMMILGSVFVLIALVSDCVWALLAGTARNWFARSPKRLGAVRGTGGVLMIGLGTALALTGNESH